MGLSSEYQSLARWFLTSGYSDFAAPVRSSFPHLLPDLSCDFTSNSSLFLTTLRSAPATPSPPTTSATLSSTPQPSLSAHLSSSHLHGVLAPPPSSSLSLTFPLPAPPSSAVPPPPGFPPLSASTSLGSGSSHMVPGLGVGVPASSGVPPYTVNSAAYAFPAPALAAWPPAYPPDPFAPSTQGAAADPFLDDDDDRFPGDVHDPLDPSAPPLALESARSEYRRMIDYICRLFPQAVGVPPPRALFESFFAPATPATSSVQLNWFDRVHISLLEADSRVAFILSSGRPERIVLPQRLSSCAVKGDCALGRAVSVNESLLSHFERPLRPNLQLSITIRDAMALKASSRAQSEALSYAMWVLSGLLGFVRLQDFTPADPALFNQLVTALSKSLAHQAQVSASHTAFLCLRHREFYLSHLPAYFSDVTKRLMLSSPAVFADSLFREEDVSRLLKATLSSSSQVPTGHG